MKLSFSKKERGQVGIGTMIVFIAMVMVAAVAASVLVQTSGYLQQRAMSIGRETTEEVSTGLQVVGVEGKASGGATGAIEKLVIFLRINTGGDEVDISQTFIKLNDGNTQAVLVSNITNTTYASKGNYTDSPESFQVQTGVSQKFNTSRVAAWNATGNRTFGLLAIQDYDGSLLSENPTMNKGDRVALLINASATFGGVGVRQKAKGEVVPEVGTPGIISFTTPSAFTERSIVDLQ